MKIHHWKMSETLKRYSTGDIIILAEDADAARAKATEEFEAYLRREDGPLGVYWTSDGQFLTEMDEERYSELLAALALDLAKEPSADEEAIFIDDFLARNPVLQGGEVSESGLWPLLFGI